MFISPFTPLCFNRHKTDGLESSYIQTFSSSDRILVQLILDIDEELDDWVLYSETNGEDFEYINYQTWEINDQQKIYFAVISPSVGMYHIEIGNWVSNIFKVTDDKRELEKTTLIQYSMKDNRQRNDTVFFIDNMQYFFDIRVPGGFKDSNWSFSVESDQFTTQFSDISQLFGLESTQKKFTLGSSSGVPVWFGEMLNRILVCSHVYFDGVKYTRKDTSVPEPTQPLEGVNSFVFTQALQQSINLDPTIEATNHLIMRRIASSDADNNNKYRKINDNTNLIN